MYEFVVFDLGQIGIVVSHGIQLIQGVGARCLREEHGKDLESC
jgi:hypothetical protein